MYIGDSLHFTGCVCEQKCVHNKKEKVMRVTRGLISADSRMSCNLNIKTSALYFLHLCGVKTQPDRFSIRATSLLVEGHL